MNKITILFDDLTSLISCCAPEQRGAGRCIQCDCAGLLLCNRLLSPETLATFRSMSEGSTSESSQQCQTQSRAYTIQT